jgi:hypothetical protein
MVFVELLLLAIVLKILQIRAWDFERLGLRFSPVAALGGVALYAAFIVAYYVIGFAIFLVHPSCRH